MNRCIVDGCTNSVHSRGWCRKHYMRWWMHGDPTLVKQTHASAGEPRAFLDAIPTEGTGCLTWPYAKNNFGYAQINTGGGRKELVSRIVCKRTHGPAPTRAHHAAHSCGKGHEACIAPWHLSWKTPSGNRADSIAHGTHRRGSDHPSAKITEADASTIRALRGKLSQAKIGRQFGVSQSLVKEIQLGRRWKHNATCTPNSSGAQPRSEPNPARPDDGGAHVPNSGAASLSREEPKFLFLETM